MTQLPGAFDDRVPVAHLVSLISFITSIGFSCKCTYACLSKAICLFSFVDSNRESHRNMSEHELKHFSERRFSVPNMHRNRLNGSGVVIKWALQLTVDAYHQGLIATRHI